MSSVVLTSSTACSSCRDGSAGCAVFERIRFRLDTIGFLRLTQSPCDWVTLLKNSVFIFEFNLKTLSNITERKWSSDSTAGTPASNFFASAKTFPAQNNLNRLVLSVGTGAAKLRDALRAATLSNKIFMKQLTRYLPMLLAAGLQLLPLLRNVLATPAAANAFAIILRWGIGAGAVVGSVDAVSGATSVFSTPSTFNGSVGVAFNNKVTVSIGGGNNAASNDYFVLSGGGTSSSLLMNNQSTTACLPPGLTFTATWVNGATTIGGTITGTPTTPGVYVTTVTCVSPGNASLSQAITITINGQVTPTAPTITSSPAAATVIAGRTATFTGAASGTTPMGYFWLKNNSSVVNGGTISGANTATLTITGVTANDAGNYSLLASNLLGTATSSAAALTVVTPPAITSQPVAQTVASGSSAQFAISATGSAPLNYRWLKNGVGVTNGVKFIGANSNVLTVATAAIGDAGNYSVVVTNLAGSATSSVAALAIVSAPTFITLPASRTVVAGTNTTFTVTAAGSAPLAYQWLKNNLSLTDGGNISGSATAALNLTAVTASDEASYSVTVSNALGSTNSGGFALTVILPPSITSQSGAQTVATGGTAQFAITATGSAPLNYRWLKNGVGLTNGVKFMGVNSNVLTVATVATNDEGNYSVIVTNLAGSTSSLAAALTVVSSPIVIIPPANQTVATGSNASFTVTAAGSAPLYFQWLKNNSPLANGANVAGATAATLTLAAVTSGDAANYSVTVSNSLGSITSSIAILTVAIPPGIVTPLENLTTTASSNVTFTVVASGCAPLNYQWRKNGTLLANGGNVSGATTASLTLANVTANDATSYSVTITNAVGSVSSSASLTVLVPPSITTAPGNATVIQGNNVSFTASASGTAPLVYQWLKDGNVIPGANSNVLVLASVTTNDAANYLVMVTNIVGSVTSSGAALTVLVPPSIITDPASATVVAGNGVSFTVVANGTTPLAYQWRKNGTNISGATLATLTLANVGPTNAGNYSVFVSNSAGNATSANAVLTVQTAPSIVTQPANQTTALGNAVTLTVNANGTTPLSYQWFKGNTVLADDGNVSGTTANVLQIASLSTNEVGIYFVVVSNFLGTATSSNASVTVNVAPLITSSPTSQTVATSNSVTFNAAATGTGPLIWQWRKNGTNLTNSATTTGATTPTLTLLNVRTNDTGNYAAFVTNIFGKATSEIATLTVLARPAITASPTNRLAKTGTNVTFAVTVTGTGPLTYQWFKNGLALTDGGNISGAATNILRVASLTMGDAGNYSVTVANAVGNATSASATLTILELPAIVTQPASQSVTLSNAATFTVSATGAPLRYQWRKNAKVIIGATNANFTIATVKTTDVGTYSVVVTNLAGSVISSNATLAINLKPTFTVQATNRWAKEGSNTIFRAAVSGTTPISYQWFKNGVALTDEGNISGSFSNVLTVANLTTNDSGNYFLTVSNIAGSASSSNATLTVFIPPTIVDPPDDQMVVVSNNATFNVAVTGTEKLRYQWRKDNKVIKGATNASLTIPRVKVADAASYMVVVTNFAGSVTSRLAALTVAVPPTFSLQPKNRSAKFGDTATFTTALKGTAPFSYRWFKNGAPLSDTTRISGSRSNILTIVNLRASDSASYSLTAYNFAGNTTSATAVLNISNQDSESDRSANLVAAPAAQAAVLPVTPLRINEINLQSDGRISLKAVGPAGAIYVLQASGDLKDWKDISTNTLDANGESTVTDSAAANLPTRFYRLTIP